MAGSCTIRALAAMSTAIWAPSAAIAGGSTTRASATVAVDGAAGVAVAAKVAGGAGVGAACLALLHVFADVAAKSLLRLAVREGHELLPDSGDNAAVAGEDAVHDCEHLRIGRRRHGTPENHKAGATSAMVRERN